MHTGPASSRTQGVCNAMELFNYRAQACVVLEGLSPRRGYEPGDTGNSGHPSTAQGCQQADAPPGWMLQGPGLRESVSLRIRDLGLGRSLLTSDNQEICFCFAGKGLCFRSQRLQGVCVCVCWGAGSRPWGCPASLNLSQPAPALPFSSHAPLSQMGRRTPPSPPGLEKLSFLGKELSIDAPGLLQKLLVSEY